MIESSRPVLKPIDFNVVVPVGKVYDALGVLVALGGLIRVPTVEVGVVVPSVV